MTFADILRGKDNVRVEARRERELEHERQMKAYRATQTPLSKAISQGQADEQDPTAALLRDEMTPGVLPPDADGAPIDEKLLALNIRIQQQREERIEQLELEKTAIEQEIASEQRAVRMTTAAIEAADRKPVMK